jgi:hypothetical protein
MSTNQTKFQLISCFIKGDDFSSIKLTVDQFTQSALIKKIYLLGTDTEIQEIEGCKYIHVDSFSGTAAMQQIAELASTDYTLIYTKNSVLELGQYSLERFVEIAQNTAAGLVYADYYQIADGVRSHLPVIDYQQGSLRDDFNFGSVLFYHTLTLQKAVAGMTHAYQFAGFYDLRLRVSRLSALFHINEFLYAEVEHDTRKSGEKIFDYVDPKNRNIQIEMEEACTDHLKNIGAYLPPVFKKIVFNEIQFPVEASVIIPVRNRIKTIGDAIQSVLLQKTNFDFNLIVVDNYSTDGTTEKIETIAQTDKRLIHIIPERKDLGIGGCWNVGAESSFCGKFAVQLDSDDIYADENTLQLIVDVFYEQNCAMVIGSYTMTNFNFETIAPGLVDHKEWTPDNGRNNALRINGLGAPRAFYSPVLREFKVPNTSYGEDYALGLHICREYQIGRIYQSVYLCRRWDDNSDASLDILKMNSYNFYKDKIRSIELMARKRLVIEEKSLSII